MVQNILVSGEDQESKAMVYKYGLTVLGTKGSGRKTELADKESSGTSTGTSLKAAGRMTKQTDMASTATPTAQCTKGTGSTISSMGRARNSGRTIRDMKATTRWGRRTASECMCGQTGLSTQENGRTT